jgi:hypothetical protein
MRKLRLTDEGPSFEDAFLPLTHAIVGDLRQRLGVCAC